MDVGQFADQLPALLGAGAGAAAKGAAGAAGKAAFDRLRERLKRDRPEEATRLDNLVKELDELSDSLRTLSQSDETYKQLLIELGGSVQVQVVSGSQLVNYGTIDKSLIARDIDTVNM